MRESNLVVNRIALVVGKPMHPRLLVCLRSLFEQYDTTAFLFEHEDLTNTLPPWVAVKIYENVVNFSGFMRGLEKDLSDFDLVIAFETDQLCSLQAMRACHERQIPFFLFCSQERPAVVAGCDHANALQFDLLQQADGILVPTRRLCANLLKQGVAMEKVFLVHAAIDQQKFKDAPERRQRFRSYIKLEAQHIVVLYHGELVREKKPDYLLKAAALVKNMVTPAAFDHLRMVFVGQGPYAQDLKYLAYNLGLGDKTYFLHQDPEPFIADLYAACDALVYPALDRAEGEVMSFPLPLLEAMASGVLPFVANNSMHAEIVGHSDFVIKGEHYQNLAMSLQLVLGSVAQRDALRGVMAQRLATEFSAPVAKKRLDQLLANLLQRTWQDRKILMDEVTAIESEAKQHSDAGLLKRISLVLKKEIPLEHKSRLFCLQGEVFTSLGRYDEAVESFESALAHHEGQSRPYRGLGYVSWHSHSHEEAMLFFKKALALDSNDAHSMLGVGLIYKRIGMIEDAIFWMERSLETCPEEKSIARHALAQACCECQDPALGISVLERALDLVGEDRLLMCTLGQLHLKAGSLDKGHEILARYLGQ